MPDQQQKKRLSLNEIRARVAVFARDYSTFGREKQESQVFWHAFFRCFGIEEPYKHGIEFERRARRASTGGAGFIDVFQGSMSGGEYRRDGFLIEQKSKGTIRSPKARERSSAEVQAQDYLDGGSIGPHEFPRWMITSDFAMIQITDHSQPLVSPARTLTFNTQDLPHHVENLLWLTGVETERLLTESQAEASVEAARLMGDLYAAMTGDADTEDEARTPEEEDAELAETAVLLTRVLFLMFGDDADLWKRDLFQTFIESRTSADGSDLGAQLHHLFENLNTPERRRDRRLDEAIAAFPYVNGGVFDGTGRVHSFDAAMRDALLKACKFDWSRISPAVFGSLFQTVKSKAARHSDGEHYTSEQNILKTVGPLFADDLRARISRATSAPQLEAIHDEMRNLRFVDPACGCGNFLIVAYRELRDLELDLITRIRRRRGVENQPVLDASELLHVRLDQFTGIEINWWPAKIAETAMYLIDHQCNQRMLRAVGVTPNRLPIEIKATIHHQNALAATWDDLLPAPGPTTYLFGNPPFLGRDRTSAVQKAELRRAWGSERVGHLDFVTAWHAKAIDYMATRVGEWAFVATNSITQGEPVEHVFAAVRDAGWSIKFAHRTFEWDSESRSDEKAVVHVVIVGFARDAPRPRLFAYTDAKADPVEMKVHHQINGYLADADALYVTRRSKPLSPALAPVAYGSMPRDDGNLLVEPGDYPAVAADPIAAKYLRPFVGAKQLIHDLPRWCLWMTDLDPSDVNRSPILKERLRKCAEMRASSKADTTREWAATPHLFVQDGQPEVPYLCIPRHFSESRRFATVARYDPSVIAGDANFTTMDPDGFVFAIISSTMFITWQRTVGGRLKSDLRFSKDVVWNNLPLPEVAPADRAQVIKAGQAVLAARALHPDRSLADHYQPLAMDPVLVAAHRSLDKVVDKAFGWDGRSRLDEVTRLRLLFERYSELVAGPM